MPWGHTSMKRGLSFSTHIGALQPRRRDGISRSLQESEESLYGDGDDETIRAYSAILEDLRQLANPVENWHKDEAARVEATRDLSSYIVEYCMSADSLPPDHKEQIINECNKAEQWPREKMQQQDTLPKTSDPVFWSSDIKSKAEELKFYDLPYPFSFAEVYTFFICYPLILSKESNVMALLFSECVSGYWDPKVLKFYLTRVTTSKTLLISMNNSHKCRLFQVQTNIPKENVGKSSSSQGINFFPNGDKKNANLTLP